MPPGVTPLEIARVVRSAREGQGLSVEALAREAALSPQRLRAIETDGAQLRLSELDAIAQGLGLDPEALAEGRVVARPSPSVFFRQSAWQDYCADDGPLLDAVLEQERALHALRGPAKRSLRTHFQPEPVTASGPIDAGHDGYAKATAVRSALRMPTQPLGDLRDLLEGRFDLSVWVLPLKTHVPALSILDVDRAAAAIVLTTQRLTPHHYPLVDRVHLAHELCHLLFDPSEPGKLHLVLESEQRNDLYESRAKAFAAELLMPQEGLRTVLGKSERPTRDTTAAVARIHTARAHFLTPWQVTALHLGNRGYIHKDLAKDLATTPQGAAPTTRTRALTLPAEGETPARILKAVRAAWTQHAITDGQARRALGIGPGEPFPFAR